MMKAYNKLIIFVLTILIFSACEQKYIDDISKIAPGSDETAPVVVINSPSNGQLKLLTVGSFLNVDLEVFDDIELQSVSIMLDGKEIKKITDFTDYRRYSPVSNEKIDISEMGFTSHTLQVKAIDLSGKTTSSDEISFDVLKYNSEAKYGEKVYMNFDNHYWDLINAVEATVVGTPGYSPNGFAGQAYAGAVDSYLTFSNDSVIGTEFSATFWYNIASAQGRSGILSSGPEGINTRTSGFRLFREGGDNNQTIKLNIGFGAADAWFDGGLAATIDPEAVDWVHIGISISENHAAVYINGVVVSEGDFEGPIDWTGCDFISIGSGAPHFIEWGHLYDLSLFDELRFYNKPLTQADIQTIINTER